MITGVRIKNLRGIRQGELRDLTSLVILVGPNGSGKSTVLDALLIGGSSCPTRAIGDSVHRRRDLARGARWLINRGLDAGDSKVSVFVDSGPEREVTLTRKPSRSSHAEFTVGIVDRSPNSQVGRGSFQIQFGPENEFSGVLAEYPIPGIKEIAFFEYRSDSSLPLHQLYTKVVERGQRDRLISIVRELIPGIHNIEILTDGDAPVVYLVFAGFAVPAAAAGDGVFWLLRLACELVSRQAGTVLVEEPETHMHPGAIRQAAQVFRAVAQTGIQIVLTTHSLELIDAVVDGASNKDLEMVSLFRLQLTDGVLKASRLPGADIAVARLEVASDLR